MKPRILYITHRVPWPPDRGDRIRTWNILKYLSTFADVDLACLADEDVSDDTLNMLKGVTKQLLIVPHKGKLRYVEGAISLAAGKTVTEGLFNNRQLSRMLAQWSQKTNYDAVMASSSGIARYAQSVAENNNAPVWIDLIDVDSQKWLDYANSARFPMSVVYRLEGQRLRNVETRLAQSSERLLVVSEAERDLFRSFCPDGPIQSIGNGVDLQYFCPDNQPIHQHSCTFVGVMNYLPNADGVKWFVSEVWPRVRQKYPDAKFNIVGKSPTPDVLKLNEVPGVYVTGSVPDVRPYLHQANCVVVPLRIARGVQNKILEAMACGRPLVCSPSPLKGLSIENDLHLLQAESPDEWLRQISQIFDDKTRASELGTAASAWVQLNHRWEACLEPLREMCSASHSTQNQEAEVAG